MKAANKRLIVSIAALVVAIALTTTATFAWFSISANPSITGLNMKVVTQSNLLVSLTGVEGTYYSNININDLSEADRTKFQGVRLYPVTPVIAGASDANYAEGDIKQNLEHLDGSLAVNGVSYFEFDVFFRASSPLFVRSQTTGTTFTSANSTNTFRAWRDFAAGELYTGSPAINRGDDMVAKTGTTAYVANAARLSFAEVAVTKTDNGSGYGSILSEVAVTPIATAATTVYRPNSGQGYSASRYNHTAFSPTNPAYDPLVPASFIGFHAAHDHFRETERNYPAIWQESNKVINFAGYDPTGESLLQLTSSGITLNGVDQYEGALRIKIWVEGTDPDAFEEILDQLLNVELRFEGLTVEQMQEEIDSLTP